MIYYLTQYILELLEGTAWADPLSGLRVFRYLTVRAAGAAITALVVSWVIGPRIIAWLRDLKARQEYRDKAEEAAGAARSAKHGTPTMGGLLIVVLIDIAVLLWAELNPLVVLALVALLALAALGFYDDYKKITEQSSAGAAEDLKLWVQLALALFIGVYLWLMPRTTGLIQDVYVPFYKYAVLTGTTGAVVGLVITVLTIVGSSNAVNLTDGLDGLAIGCTLIVTFVFLVVTYLAGNVKFATYLQIPYVAGAGELSVFCAAMIGASLGFLWFNCHPAQVFMGDTGSLALGGALGIIAVLVHQPFLLVIAGGVFVAEAVSVMIQRGWFKYTKRKYGAGRRVFLMAPLHHHFQRKGWHEPQVVTRFYILCLLCGLVALSTLKLR
jgi:phospho-N-acetylmuramoyl-pentapeptide-transferase